MVPNQYRNKGRSGYKMVFGTTPNISEYIEFKFYDYCWYWDTPQSYPHEKKQIRRWLGILAHRVGQSMVYYIMNTNGKVIARSTVIPLDPSDYEITEIKTRMTELDNTIKTKIGDYRNAMNQRSMTIILRVNLLSRSTSRRAIYTRMNSNMKQHLTLTGLTWTKVPPTMSAVKLSTNSLVST